MKKSFVAIFLICLMAAAAGAQTHNSVPISEDYLYDFLEMAEIRGYVDPLPSTRPYSTSRVAAALREIARHRRDLNDHEWATLEDLIERFDEDPDLPFNLDGEIRVEDDVFPTKFGAYLSGTLNMQFYDFSDYILGEAIVGGYVRGDIGNRGISWGVDVTGGAFLVDDYDGTSSYGPTSYEPYKFTKHWDGGVHFITELSQYKQMATSLSGGYSYETEVVGSFWDNRLELQFGRLRHDWGIGEGNLFLDAQARPFMGFGGVIDPWKWITVSYISGILEYGENFRNIDDYNIRHTSKEQQNMLALLQIELQPFKWLYLSFFDSAIYLKRPEWGYTFPLMSQFLSQNNTGDYDNLAMGGSLALSWPGYFRSYFSVYLDEARFHHDDFFSNPANMYAYQAGIKVPVPKMPWSIITLQYTKIEPFTYTHYYLKTTPWYTAPDEDLNGVPDYAYDTGYMNGGEPLGYALEPNSDELMLQIRSQIRRGMTWMFRYRMVRHGYAGSGGPYGSTFDAWGYSTDGTITPDNDPEGPYSGAFTKNFLKDGIYEWFHIFTLGGDLDTRLWNEAVQFAVEYSFIYQYYTDYSSNGDYRILTDPGFGDIYRNILSVSAKVSPW